MENTYFDVVWFLKKWKRQEKFKSIQKDLSFASYHKQGKLHVQS